MQSRWKRSAKSFSVAADRSREQTYKSSSPALPTDTSIQPRKGSLLAAEVPAQDPAAATTSSWVHEDYFTPFLSPEFIPTTQNTARDRGRELAALCLFSLPSITSCLLFKYYSVAWHC